MATFEEKILKGKKIHSIRTDKTKRWKAGMSIQFWRGNPRNRGSYFGHKFPGDPPGCVSVQEILIQREGEIPDPFITVGGRILFFDQMRELIGNDGLTPTEFMDWFLPPGVDEYKGRLIHWTDKTY